MTSLKKEYETIYTYCSENQELLERYKNCTCLYCGKKFEYNFIEEWINDKNAKTAICPYCNIDSVVPTKVNNNVDKYVLNKKMQEEIKRIYFGK